MAEENNPHLWIETTYCEGDVIEAIRDLKLFMNFNVAEAVK